MYVHLHCSLHFLGVNFVFSNYYASSMVLQRSPARAVVWGYGFNTGDTVSVTINVGGQDLVYETTTVDGKTVSCQILTR